MKVCPNIVVPSVNEALKETGNSENVGYSGIITSGKIVFHRRVSIRGGGRGKSGGLCLQ